MRNGIIFSNDELDLIRFVVESYWENVGGMNGDDDIVNSVLEKVRDHILLSSKNNDIINERWLVTTDGDNIRFCHLTDEDLDILKKGNVLTEPKEDENVIWICCEDADMFVCEYIHGDFNGYKQFLSVTEAMEWCENHTKEEIRKLLSN